MSREPSQLSHSLLTPACPYFPILGYWLFFSLCPHHRPSWAACQLLCISRASSVTVMDLPATSVPTTPAFNPQCRSIYGPASQLFTGCRVSISKTLNSYPSPLLSTHTTAYPVASKISQTLTFPSLHSACPSHPMSLPFPNPLPYPSQGKRVPHRLPPSTFKIPIQIPVPTL